MESWKVVWTALWFGGLVVFTLLTLVLSVQGLRDLRALLSGLRPNDDADSPGP